ncbi:hypothetical protein B0H13DRAFT_1923977 [Mycena leptocephala]|nr:hypothetical protein B0H13DRAFT_1923977 [Mycena leptocephala]
MADDAIKVRGGEENCHKTGQPCRCSKFRSLSASVREFGIQSAGICAFTWSVAGTYNHAFPVAVRAGRKRGAKATKQENGYHNGRDHGFETLAKTFRIKIAMMNTRIMRRVDQRGGELADAKGLNRYDLELDGGVIQIEMRPVPDAENKGPTGKDCCLVQDLNRSEMNSGTAARPE